MSKNISVVPYGYKADVRNVSHKKSWKDQGVTTTDIGVPFSQYITDNDAVVEDFLNSNTKAGDLTLTTAQSLQLQKLMGDQSIFAQTATSTLKSIKDSISASSRNIG